METLRVGLNKARYLGLFEYECHYAIFSEGSSYAKHSDVLAGPKNRIVSTVLYLNENWQASDGGELVLLDPDGGTVITTVQPTFGSLSGILCVRHNMSKERNMYAKQKEDRSCARGGVAADSAGMA